MPILSLTNSMPNKRDLVLFFWHLVSSLSIVVSVFSLNPELDRVMLIVLLNPEL
jgi:hypothetical protein